jgi:hypothetical protein
MEALARHELRRRLLAKDLDRIAALIARTEAQEAAGAVSRKVARHALGRLDEAHHRVYAELLYHTRGVVANSLTASGAAATPEEAPDYWTEITAEDESRILAALFQAGPGRYAALGPPPEPDKKHKARWNEDMGFHSLLECISRERKMAPAALRDVDVFQLLTSLRAAGEKSLAEELDA